MALNSPLCADVPLSNYSLTVGHSDHFYYLLKLSAQLKWNWN